MIGLNQKSLKGIQQISMKMAERQYFAMFHNGEVHLELTPDDSLQEILEIYKFFYLRDIENYFKTFYAGGVKVILP